MDFPNFNESATPLHIGSYSRYSGLWDTTPITGNIQGGSSQTWLAANKAVYIPLYLPYWYTVQRVWWWNGSSVTSVNNDLGVYAADGTRMYSTGSTAQSGASVLQYVTVSTPFRLSPGRYFLALAISSVTANRGGTGGSANTLTRLRQAGVMEEASALPLPATATFAAVTATQPTPQFGITRLATGF